MKTHTPLFLRTAGLFCSLTLGLAGAQSWAADATLDHSDKSFITNAYQDGLAEIKMGEMGESKASNADVKKFAKQMVTDHTKANTELKALADSKKVEVPTEPSMAAKAKAKWDDMKSGPSFDKAFMDSMVTDHEKAVSAFENASTGAKDADVKALATKTLPTLKSHLKMAQDLRAQVSK